MNCVEIFRTTATDELVSIWLFKELDVLIVLAKFPVESEKDIKNFDFLICKPGSASVALR